MIKFRKEKKYIIISYSTNNDNSWLLEKLEHDEVYLLKKVYSLSAKNLYNTTIKRVKENKKEDEFLIDYPDPLDFIFAKLEGEYYKIIKGILINKFNIYIHKDIILENKFFVAEGSISIFKKISQIINEDIYVGGNNLNAISEIDFRVLIKGFPSQYEKNLYLESRLTNTLKEFFASTGNAEKKFQNYINKKATLKGQNLTKLFSEIELFKYETILDKLEGMLSSEISYSENQWQDEILQIILLLYPKYCLVFKEAPIITKYDKDKNIREERYIDILLVDSDGNIDLIEIKKPSNTSLMTSGQFRNNFIPLRELSGTVMQIEKYIYYLNRWGEDGEKYLTKKYKDKIPEGFNINITNPKGIIIIGRIKGLTLEQKKDFEVVKRKYKNVLDIISYDDLLNRLKLTIEQIKNC
ncbi:Shedu immune nuclease family protein [Chryseobacterium bernardetii]|uniref:Shedu immune nuclease family protein n=1 Tax=Chryseobacterium bernardetii TaxID=1241978 RepID=UPI0016246BC3|nr:Shedu immune nuclease family protein [Chryseobacterium bernardetii]